MPSPRDLLRRGAYALSLLLVCTLVAVPLNAAARGGKKKDEKSAAEVAFDTGYGSDDAKERSEAVAALRDAPDVLKVKLISEKVVPREKRADVIASAVAVLSRVKDEGAVNDLVSLAGKGKPDRRVVYLEALAKVDGSASHELLLQAVKDKEPRVRGMAAFALGQHRAMDALDPLLKLLEDPHWQVQAASLESIRRLSDKEELRARAVPVLVDYLDLVTGRLSVDAAETLAKITGKRLGRDPAKWRRYMAGEDVDANTGGDGEGEGGAKSGGAYGNAAERPHFYGMEVVSNRVVLLMDISLSMNDPIEIDKDRLRRETSRRKTVTGQKGEGDDADDEDRAYDIPWWRIKTRLDLAREQTILLISQMREDQEFDIIFFSTKVEPWMGRLVPANSANKQKAIAKLQSLKPDDKTNTWGALAAAFDLMHNQKKSYEKGPDELYLVTDGAPSVGDIVEPDQILEAVLQLHKTMPIRINCIGVGVNLRFMRKMCRRTGGQAKFFE
jgi:hypothetical protein